MPSASSSVSALEHTAVGALAGVLEVAIMQPTVGIKNALQEGRPIPRTVPALYRGIGVSAGAMLPITAVQFGMNRALEQGYRRVTGADKLTTGGTVAVALGAGAASAFLGCPAEFVMIQQQKAGRSLPAELRHIVNTYGALKPFKGLSATIMRESFYATGYLAMAPILREWLSKQPAMQDVPGGPYVVSGLMAGLLATLTSQPADTIKTRMQAFPDNAAHPEYRSFMSTVRHIMATEGAGTFLAGFGPRAFRICCAVFILNGTRNTIVDALQAQRTPHVVPAAGQLASMAEERESTAANAWVDSYLDALLSYGLSSEYLKSTKEAEAKDKAPDADRSIYSRYYVQSLLNMDEQALHSAWAKASSATRAGGEKDARLQYLSWRIWFMRRRHALVKEQQRGGEEEAVMTPTSYSDSEDEEAEEYMRAGYEAAKSPAERERGLERERARERSRREASPFGKQQLAAGDMSPTRGALPPSPLGRGAEDRAAAEGAAPAAKRQLQVKIGGAEVAPAADKLDTVFEDFGTPEHTPRAPPLEHRFDRLYVILISLHGLVRGEHMELGRDSDTGGQVKYVVELAKALALHPAVHRVELLTRLIRDPSVDASYGQEEECLVKGRGELGGAYIVRLPCGPTHQYVRKELLWPYVREFADRGIQHANGMLAAMAEAGRRCELYAVHGHYADAGEVAVLMSSSLDVHMVMTGHSLGRNKLEHLLASGSMTRGEIEEAYAISRRIEAEERCLDNAVMVFTSTRQEVDEQWGLYDGYSPQLSRVLRFHRSMGRHMPNMKVIPPGLDFSALKVSMPEDPTLKEFEQARALQDMLERPQPLSPLASGVPSGASSPRPGLTLRAEVSEGAPASPAAGSGAAGPATPSTSAAAAASSGQQSPRGGGSSGGGGEVTARPPLKDLVLDPVNGPPIWREITRFLRNPGKPAVLAMSRPDPKKNLTTLVDAFGRHAMLRELANLVLIMGNRDNIDSMASGTQKVLTQVLKLVDAHDLYGSVAYPKHHTQKDISDIYLFAAATRGVFVNIALQEPFGLTVIEAAAHGVPTVATKNGGPVDIMATLHHGVVVDPTDSDAVAAALLGILTHPQTWDDMSTSGVKNIMAYSWPSHCKKYLDSIEAEKRSIKVTRKHERTLSGLLGKRPALPGLTETAKEEHDSLAGGIAHGGSEPLSRYFSTPQPLVKGEVEFASSAVAGGPLGPGPQSVRKTISGVSNDDLAILQSLDVAELGRGGEAPPLAAGRHHLVVLPLDSDYVLPQATAALRGLLDRLESSGQRKHVGVGLLSMLGFESTCEHLQAAGIGREELDFMVCNSGADVWLQWPGGRWDADEAYEGQIGFEWDRIVLHRMLTKIISQPQADNKARRLPRLKELLYNVQEQPAAGVHPRHICLELDPETQAILSAGMGPRSRSNPTAARSLAVVDRLRRRLRSKGLRASYNLQMVPREQDYLAVLHITPLRASRPLALRYLAQRVGRPLDRWVVLALAPETVGSADGGDLVAGSYCSDTTDLLGGLQKVCVVTPEGREGGPQLPNSGSLARSGLGVALQPYLQEGTGRLAVAPSGQESETVLQLVQQEGQAQRAEAKAEA